MTLGLKRFYGEGHLHFITFSCYQRLPLLDTAEARDIFLEELGNLRDVTGFQLIGYVVMPEHVHLLMSEPLQGTPSTVLQRLKLRVARRLRKSKGAFGVGPTPSQAGEPIPAFWQARFYDFNVYSQKKKVEKLDYMHANPVVRGLVDHPREWRWSSWAYFYGNETAGTRVDVER